MNLIYSVYRHMYAYIYILMHIQDYTSNITIFNRHIYLVGGFNPSEKYESQLR